LTTLASFIEEAKAVYGYKGPVREIEEWLENFRVKFQWTLPLSKQEGYDEYVPLLVYDEDLQERLRDLPNLQDLRWQVVIKIRQMRQWLKQQQPG
jgi:hypothetical protein